jgi:16S rRNA (guanine966-N2)-methyltransferase
VIRIVAGRWKGRKLLVPPGRATRPTSDRARQALFDMLMHAPFAGRAAVEGARVLDAFAGTGALGIEALSRGAAEAVFIENDAAALAALRANIAGLAGVAAQVLAADATDPPAPSFAVTLAFLDPPYGQGLATRALAALVARGWFAEGALVCVETARDEELVCGTAPPPRDGVGGRRASHEALPPNFSLLDDRAHGKARLRTLRFSGGSGASR